MMADMSPQLEPDSPSASSPSIRTRLRAHSHTFLDKVRRSPSRGHEQRPGAAFKALANAGAVSGSIGSPLIDPKTLQEEKEAVKAGAEVFLQELERVASRPATERSRTGTIDLRVLPSQQDEHPILSSPNNPFKYTPDNASDRSYDFTETIQVLRNDQQPDPIMRALLDTGMRMNAIHHDKAITSKFPILPYHGPRIKDADGPAFDPIGIVKLQFYFKSHLSARTWDVEFVVLKDPPFDVALGHRFINQAGLLQRAEPMLPMAFEHQSEKEKKDQAKRTQERDEESERRKEEERKKRAERNRIEREKKNKDRDKRGR
jgi:hypothetical protein